MFLRGDPSSARLGLSVPPPLSLSRLGTTRLNSFISITRL